jgi:two-component system OmpR family sensor kinase
MLAAQERAAEQQRQFLADASHELRSPLTVLTSEVELALRRPRTAAEYEQALQQVAQDTARLVTLADQLLDLEQASTSLGSEVADVPAALRRAAERGRARLGDTEREVRVVAGGPPLAALPEVALDQVLGNLVDNAVVHGAGTITLAAVASEEAVVLTVTDEGSGPPQGLVPHLVERFRRADPARSTPGSGLGLAVVHALVAAHGGELRLCSGRRHHRYPPHLHPAVDCAHADAGTCASVVLRARP